MIYEYKIILALEIYMSIFVSARYLVIVQASIPYLRNNQTAELFSITYAISSNCPSIESSAPYIWRLLVVTYNFFRNYFRTRFGVEFWKLSDPQLYLHSLKILWIFLVVYAWTQFTMFRFCGSFNGKKFQLRTLLWFLILYVIRSSNTPWYLSMDFSMVWVAQR